MMKNRELFEKDPTTFVIPNEGVTKIFEPRTEKEWAVLRYEMTSFVCDGEYHKGMDRVLASFLSNVGNPEQQAVWVYGFYGSGKSHFVRVLEYLWRDILFSDGASARSLTTLPNEIQDSLVELTTMGKREGGLWSAAGRLSSSAGPSVRLAVLGILFRSAGLPDKFPLARFVLWLGQNGYYEDVKSAIENQGRDFNKELHNMYVSPYLAQAILSVHPTFAEGPAKVGEILFAQYPNPDEPEPKRIKMKERKSLNRTGQ